MKITDNIYWIAGAPWGTLGNAYAIIYSKGVVLIDCSRNNAIEKIFNNLDYWGINKELVTHILLTHGHDDHVGESAYFQKKGAKVIVGEFDAPMVIQGNMGIDNPCTNHVSTPLTPDVLISEDTNITIGELKFQTICTPGHTDGHVVYLLNLKDTKVLFAGDLFYTEGKYGEETLTGWKGDTNYSSQKLGESFKKMYLMNLEIDIVLTGHGIPRFGRDAESIKMAYRYYLKNDR